MKKLIFFIFILSCTVNKENFKKDFNQVESIQIINKTDEAKLVEKLLPDEAEKAIKNDDLSKLKELFSQGLRINRKYNGKTLLFRAIENDRKVCIKYLLSQGAIISEEFDKCDLKDKEIEWELSTTAWKRSISLDNLTTAGICIKILKEQQRRLAEEIFINLKSKNPNDEEDFILNRIKAGANINEPIEEVDGYKYSALHALAPRGTKLILEEFLKRYEGNINEVDDEGRTALSHAIEGNIIFAKALLDKGLDPNVHNSENLGYAPTVYAIHAWNSHEDIEFLETLIQKTSRDDILKESSNLLIKLVEHCEKQIIRLKNDLKKYNIKEESLDLQKELDEKTIKIKKIKDLKNDLERKTSSDTNTKNIF